MTDMVWCRAGGGGVWGGGRHADIFTRCAPCSNAIGTPAVHQTSPACDLYSVVSSVSALACSGRRLACRQPSQRMMCAGRKATHASHMHMRTNQCEVAIYIDGQIWRGACACQQAPLHQLPLRLWTALLDRAAALVREPGLATAPPTPAAAAPVADSAGGWGR